MLKRYLLWFAHEHIDFRYAEMQSLLHMFNIKMNYIEKPSLESLFWVVEFDSDEHAKKIASRSISLRWCIELWGRGKEINNLHKNLQESLYRNDLKWHDINEFDYVCPKYIMENHFHLNKSFKITIETFCKHFSNEEKLNKIKNFSYLPVQGPVCLRNPDVEIMSLEFYGLNPNNTLTIPLDVFIGRKIAEGQRHLISKLSLKNRKFIGNTSMDPQLSLYMANQAQISPGDLVIDPFVGSGSLLVAAAYFGGYVWGADIDYLMVHARSKPSRFNQKVRENNENIKGNMEQYNISNRYLDVIVSDFSKTLWKDTMKLDAIITDPPYGIREPTEKIGIEKENYKLSPEQLSNHIPSKVDYNLLMIYNDLLSFAAKYLHIGKRLVCWFPYYREDYAEEKLPFHNCLKLVANSEQILSTLTARRLLTYEKLNEPLLCNGELNGNCSIMKNMENINLLNNAESMFDFRYKYFFSQEQTRKEKKENAKKFQHNKFSKNQ